MAKGGEQYGDSPAIPLHLLLGDARHDRLWSPIRLRRERFKIEED